MVDATDFCIWSRKRMLEHLQVLYECKDSLKSQSGSLPRATVDDFNRINSWNSTAEDPYTRWRRFVARYFSLSLSYDSDRLPALSGLAKSKSRQIKDRMVGKPTTWQVSGSLLLRETCAGAYKETMEPDLRKILRHLGRGHLSKGKTSPTWPILRSSTLQSCWSKAASLSKITRIVLVRSRKMALSN